MKREKLDELEGRQIKKSWSLGAGDSGDEAVTDDKMDASMMSIMEKLTPHQQERAKSLWEELVDLKVKPGLRNRLMGMGHMGALNDPIWRYIYKLRTGKGMRNVRDKGGWLVKCLLNERGRV